MALGSELSVEICRTFTADGQAPAEAHPRIQRLISYWRSLVPHPGLLPARRHFDPLGVRELMPHLWLVDVVPDDPRRYRARLVGGALVEAGAPIRRGEYFSDVMTEEEIRRSNEVFDRVAYEKVVDWRRGPSVLRKLKHVTAIERVLMPMAADGMTVDMLLCMTLFYWTDGRIY
jgi:hypothetical protein